MSQGSGLVLLFHSMGEHDGNFGSWAFHKGGNGGFTQVLARAARPFGAEILLDSEVDSVLQPGRRDSRSGARRRHRAQRIRRRQRAGPRRTFLELVDPRELPGDW
jgi:phytoene dehydrogenase-like protein